MSKKILIAIISVCAVVAIAAALIAAQGVNNGNNNTVPTNDGDGNGDNNTTDTTVTMTGISVLYNSAKASNTICVEYSDVADIMDRITAEGSYSNGTSKAITGYTKTSTLGSTYSIGDEFTVTVSYESYSASVKVTVTEDDTAAIVITCDSGSADCYTITEDENDEFVVTISGITEDTTYLISGTLEGYIVIDVGDDYNFELQMENLMVTSSYNVPIYIESGNNVTISAKNGTVNTVTDNRSAVDDDGTSACIYSKCDLNIQGKGTLNVISENNNGIHTKDDLSVKNLTLYVKCQDNALKGNDSVTIRSGNITLIAKTGDCIKTTNSDDSKDKQRGTITVCSDKGDLTMNLYAACDGIDAAYNVEIYEAEGNTVTLNIYTDQYSSYSEEVTEVSSDVLYIRTTTSSYKYSVYFYNSSSDYQWENATYYSSTEGGMGRTYYYYKVDVPTGYEYLKVYTYNQSQEQGQSTSYASATRMISINTSFNVLIIDGNRYEWSTYGKDSSTGPGQMDPGGQGSGNTDKGDYSTKGIKADNSIMISSGTVFVKSYDDAIHANGGDTLENGETGEGSVSISGGTLTLYSNDDGIHGDGTVTISGGTVSVTKSYEGIEGTVITVSGGDVSVVSSDDGMNGTSTSGESIIISGGKVYVYAGGDGLDSNSTTSYDGILISGGESVIIATSADNSAIDTERGYRYTGGKVVAIGRYGGMGNETVNCSNFSSVGTNVSKSLTKGTYVTVGSIVSVKMPCALSAQIVYLGSNSVTISTSSSSIGTDDSNGVCWA